MTAIRFWHYGIEPVLIRIKAGQTLHHYTAHATDEGWTSEANEWEFDGTTLTCRWYTDGVDCDGRLSRSGESSCRVEDVMSGHTDEDGRTFPAWDRGESSQRDFSAEAAGY